MRGRALVQRTHPSTSLAPSMRFHRGFISRLFHLLPIRDPHGPWRTLRLCRVDCALPSIWTAVGRSAAGRCDRPGAEAPVDSATSGSGRGACRAARQQRCAAGGCCSCPGLPLMPAPARLPNLPRLPPKSPVFRLSHLPDAMAHDASLPQVPPASHLSWRPTPRPREDRRSWFASASIPKGGLNRSTPCTCDRRRRSAALNAARRWSLSTLLQLRPTANTC